MSHVSCSQFRANFWRPTICAYCYRPKARHSPRKAESEGRRSSSFGSAVQLRVNGNKVSSKYGTASKLEAVPRSATISSSSPTKLRECRQRSEPPRSPLLERDSAEESDGRRVGVVKPYAVVEINEQWVRQNLDSSGRLVDKRVSPNTQENNFFQWKPLSRSRFASCTSLQPPPRPDSADDKRRRIIPKRKAPPPPDRPPSRMSRAASAPSVTAQRNRCEGGAGAYVQQEDETRRSPPRKPPRTQSTFVSDFGDLLLSTGAAAKAYREASYPLSPSPPRSQPGDYEPLQRPLLGSSNPHMYTSKSMVIPHQVVELFDNTLAEIASLHLQQLGPHKLPWEVEWAELTMCTDELGQQHLYYHNGQCVVVEPFQPMHCTELQIARCMNTHLNVSTVRGILSSAPADMVDVLPLANQYVVRDSSSLLTSLREVMPVWRLELSEEDYIHRVLLVLLNVLRGLSFLYSNGVVHRDIGMDSLLVKKEKGGHVVKIGSFQYALHHPGPLSATSFIYAFHELQWLGGTDACLPPEIMDTADNAQTLNYAHTDSFAVGCLIYELMTGENPFEQDSQLVFSKYRDEDLPPFPQRSPTALHLRRLACMMLRRDPIRRLSSFDALLVVQVMLWEPVHWLDHPVTNTEVCSQLLISKSSLLATLAKRKDGEEVELEEVLKAEFLSSCTSADLVRTIAVFTL